jgi:hypothetical protein
MHTYIWAVFRSTCRESVTTEYPYIHIHIHTYIHTYIWAVFRSTCREPATTEYPLDQSSCMYYNFGWSNVRRRLSFRVPTLAGGMICVHAYIWTFVYVCICMYVMYIVCMYVCSLIFGLVWCLREAVFSFSMHLPIVLYIFLYYTCMYVCMYVFSLSFHSA